MTRQRLRRVLLGAALALTLGSAILAPSEESQRAPPVAQAAAASVAVNRGADVNAPEVLRLSPYERRVDEGPVLDLFEPRSPPPAAAPAPVAPAAPALPFAYLGSVEDDGKTKVYLIRGESILEAIPGSVFAPDYRLDSIEAQGLRITYLPMKLQQTLPTGDAK